MLIDGMLPGVDVVEVVEVVVPAVTLSDALILL